MYIHIYVNTYRYIYISVCYPLIISTCHQHILNQNTCIYNQVVLTLWKYIQASYYITFNLKELDTITLPGS